MKTIYPITTNKIAVITGGAKGIGAQIVHRFLYSGYNVVMSYKTSEKEAVALEKQYGKDRLTIVKADLTDYEAVKELRDIAINKYKSVDTLINNAGTSYYGILPDMTEADIMKVMSDNLLSAINVTKAFYDDFAFGHKGSIINISSVWGLKGASYESIYSAAKAGIIGFTEAIAKELAPSGVRVNAVAPGAIMTDMMKGFSESELEEIISEIPLKRLGTPEDVAGVVEFLASDRASYITGQVLNISGGYVI